MPSLLSLRPPPFLKTKLMRSPLFQEALLILHPLLPYLGRSNVATGHLSHHTTSTSFLKALTLQTSPWTRLTQAGFSVL